MIIHNFFKFKILRSKKYISLFLFLLFLVQCNKSIDLNETVYKSLNKTWEKDGIKGRAKQKTVTYYSVTNQINEEIKIVCKSSTKYNAKGNQIEFLIYLSNSTIYKKTIYTYDKYDNLIEETEYIEDNNRYNKKILYKFYENPIAIKSFEYNSENKLERETQYIFNSQDILIEILIMDKNRDYSYKETFRYGDNNDKIEWITFEPKDKMKKKETYIYDNNHKLLESRFFDKDNNPTYRHVFRYDKNENLIEDIYYKVDDYHSRYLLKYNQKGILFEYIHYDSNSKFDFKNNIFLDEIGNYKKSLTYKEDKNGENILQGYYQYGFEYF